MGLTPGVGRAPGEGNGSPLQCSCLENPRDGGSLAGCRLWGCTESDTTDVTQQQQQDIIDLKSLVNQFSIIKIYSIFTQQRDTNSIQVPIDDKPGDTGMYPGT